MAGEPLPSLSGPPGPGKAGDALPRWAGAQTCGTHVLRVCIANPLPFVLTPIGDIAYWAAVRDTATMYLHPSGLEVAE